MINNIKDFIKAYWLYILPHHLISRLTYILTRTNHPLKNFLINIYIKIFGVNMNECEITSIDKYETFCDFFTRKLKKGIHKVDNRKRHTGVCTDEEEKINCVTYNKKSINCNIDINYKNNDTDLAKCIWNKFTYIINSRYHC